MRLNSIRARTLLALALICVAIVSMLGGIWLYTTSQNIKSNIYTTDLHDSRLLSGYIREYLDSVENAAVTISVDPDAVTAIRTGDATRIKPDIDGMVNSTSQQDIGLLTDKDGRLIYSTADPPSDPPVSGPVPASGNSTYVTGIYYSNVTRDHVFAVVSPVRDNGSIIGYFYDEVLPVDMGQFFERSRMPAIDRIILVDGNGRVISRGNSSALREHADLSAYPPVQKMLNGEEGVMEHSADNRQYISAYAPIPNTSWGLMVSTEEGAAYQPVQSHALKILGMCLLFIAALMVFGYFASTYLIDPVERLSRTMRRVSAGDYTVSIEARRRDEIGDLERSFNSLVSEIKKRDEVIRAEKDRSEFYLDLMSHDINNMNHSGMGYLELAMDNLRGHADARDLALLEKAYDALKNSSSLIGSVRQIKKVQASLQATEELDLGGLLAEVQDKYARYPGRDVAINYAPASCSVQASGLFKEVLSNIVENAIKHSDPSRPLTITMALSREIQNGRAYCRVSIEDNGPGIPNDMKEAIFNRFQRGPSVQRGFSDSHGKGLGLYIVKMLVEEYGGKVWAEDRIPGDYTKGVRFVVLMPAAAKNNAR